MIIYRITNTITTKSYIGQTINSLDKRWKRHIKDSEKFNYKFSRALRKYPIESWNKEIIETLDDINSLNEREVYWISQYDTFKNGYNSTTGGEKDKNITDETRKKLGEKSKGNKYCLGYKHTDESRLKMSKRKQGKNNSFYNKKHKSESIEKIRETSRKNSLGKIWINDGYNNKFINPDFLDYYVSIGFVNRGRSRTKKI